VSYKVEGAGEIDADGKLTIPADAGHTAIKVTATVGDLSGLAQARIVPPLPWDFDFEGMSDPPISWVGARYRHIIREVDGNKVMVKITTIPKGARSRAWFGQSDLKNYTIQADVRGGFGNGRLPDIGLTGAGYCLDLQSAQKLQIRSWVPQLRMAKEVPFSWEKDKWYTMKYSTSVSEDGKTATLKGKVWPKGEAEPEAWTVEAEDTIAVGQGSPGLYGNAKDAEIFLDNISVKSN